jgi:NADPH-dependent curcumin reductase CurA
MPTQLMSREIRLASRPAGLPTAATFAFAESEVPALGDGQVLVRNRFLSVEPYMRERMDGRVTYMPPYAVGEAMDGAAVGEVIESRSAALSPGEEVWHFLGWREVAIGDAEMFVRLDVDGIPPSAYLGALGTPGLAAYVGIVDVAAVGPGDTVFISGAAGAVGSLAGQIARIRGAGRVIGTAGSPEKVAWLVDELGFDAAFDRHDGPVGEWLAAAAPDGIDVAFDNVGGEQLAAAIHRMRTDGRIALCGMIGKDDAAAPGLSAPTLFELIVRRVTARGFLVMDHMDRLAEFRAEAAGWLRSGRVLHRETIVDGLDRAPDAFLGLYRGDSFGKTVVRLDG